MSKPFHRSFNHRSRSRLPFLPLLQEFAEFLFSFSNWIFGGDSSLKLEAVDADKNTAGDADKITEFAGC